MKFRKIPSNITLAALVFIGSMTLGTTALLIKEHKSGRDFQGDIQEARKEGFIPTGKKWS